MRDYMDVAYIPVSSSKVLDTPDALRTPHTRFLRKQKPRDCRAIHVTRGGSRGKQGYYKPVLPLVFESCRDKTAYAKARDILSHTS